MPAFDQATHDEIDRMIRAGRRGLELCVGDDAAGCRFEFRGDGMWRERKYKKRFVWEAQRSEREVRDCIEAASPEQLARMRAALGGPAMPEEVDRMIAAAIAGAELHLDDTASGDVFRFANGRWTHEEYEKGMGWDEETTEEAVRTALAKAQPRSLDNLRFALSERGKEVDRWIAAARGGALLRLDARTYRFEAGKWFVERPDTAGVPEETWEHAVRHALAEAGSRNVDRLRAEVCADSQSSH